MEWRFLEATWCTRLACDPVAREPRALRSVSIWSLAVLMVCFGGEPRLLAQSAGSSSARELLALHGIDSGQLDRFQDGEAIGATDEETLIRILERFPRFPREKLERWSKRQVVDWSAVSAAPGEYRGGVFHIQGRARNIERIPLLPEVANRLEFREYYRVTMQLAEAPHVAIVCTRSIPLAWRSESTIDEPVAAIGIFLKCGSSKDSVAPNLFVTERVAWFPKKADSQRGITEGQAYLATLGFDVGLLDEARAENKKPLSLADRECFYQLLAAVGRSNSDAVIARTKQPGDLAALLRDPTKHQGNLVTFDGIARRAMRIRVDDSDIRERFGLDHYFQIDLFVDLDKQVVRLGKNATGGESPIFENSYPITVCVPSLPPNLPEGEILRENIRVHAAFFKLWTYPSEYAKSFGVMQQSPMLIGIQPQVVKLPEFNPGFGVGLAVLVVVSLIGLWFGFRQTGRASVTSRANRGLVRDKSESSFQDDPLALPDRPDFSHLDSLPKSEEKMK
jgi:hypothetical protein